MTAPTPPPAPGRGAFSHVDREGRPKRAFETERAAAVYGMRLASDTGAPFTWYVCSQRPEHWHVARERRP